MPVSIVAVLPLMRPYQRTRIPSAATFSFMATADTKIRGAPSIMIKTRIPRRKQTCELVAHPGRSHRLRRLTCVQCFQESIQRRFAVIHPVEPAIRANQEVHFIFSGRECRSIHSPWSRRLVLSGRGGPHRV